LADTGADTRRQLLTARATAPVNTVNRRVRADIVADRRIVARMVGYFKEQVNDRESHGLGAGKRGERMDQPKVFVYALSTCGHCRAAKMLLDQKGVKYDFVDVDLLSRDELKKVLEEVAKVNPQRSFPTLVIGEKVVVGNREDEILEALGL
jgi:glutaredoxin